MSSNTNARQSWKVPASIISKRTSNPIRAIVDHIKVKPNANKSMISLALGDPTLFGNFKIHETCTEAVSKQLHSYKSNGYPPSTGYLHARQAVADKFTLPAAPLVAQDVIITSGCSGALDMCIGVLCNEGDNILLPRPGFSLYQTLADSKGVEVRYYDLLVRGLLCPHFDDPFIFLCTLFFTKLSLFLLPCTFPCSVSMLHLLLLPHFPLSPPPN
jgi:tyrosine aminotransferase